MANSLILEGNQLTINGLNLFILKPKLKVAVAQQAMRRVAKSYRFLRKVLGSPHQIIYGVNTGFGPMASHILDENHLMKLQENLIRSHAVGMGQPVKPDWVLAAMVVRLNTLLRGYSGVSPQLVERLAMFINLRIIPVVPEHGSVGASGDLVQLAHLGLGLMGEGEVFYRGEQQLASKVLEKLGIGKWQPKPKEGLSLINGTSAMAGVAAVLCVHSERVLKLAILNAALALETVCGFEDSISDRLHRLRPHVGQMTVARALRGLLASSHLLRDRQSFYSRYKVGKHSFLIPETVQEVYSLRCVAQILGPVFEAWQKTAKETEIEINSVTDNPIIDLAKKQFLHGGNFHGDYIAASVDQLKATLVKLTMLSERRINFFLNRNANKFLPPFLNVKKPGLDLALQGLQFVATSTTAQSQTLAFPHYVHSIPSNADNQDVVSMGMDAAILAMKVVENAYIVLAIEAVTLSQVVEILAVKKKLSRASKKLYLTLRRIFPAVTDDRVMILQLSEVLNMLKDSSKFDFNWDLRSK